QEPEERPRRVPPIEPAVPLVGQAPVLPAPPTISRARPHAKIWYADEGCPIEPHGVVQRGADEPAARWTAAHRATAASSKAPTSAFCLRSASAVRGRLSAVRQAHVSLLLGLRGPPQMTQIGSGESTTPERSGWEPAPGLVLRDVGTEGRIEERGRAIAHLPGRGIEDGDGPAGIGSVPPRRPSDFRILRACEEEPCPSPHSWRSQPARAPPRRRQRRTAR